MGITGPDDDGWYIEDGVSRIPGGTNYYAKAASWTQSQSYDSYLANVVPWDYPDARACAIAHVRDLDSNLLNFWNPGDPCPVVTPTHDDYNILDGVSAGLAAGYNDVRPQLLQGSSYSAYCRMGGLRHRAYAFDYAVPGQVPSSIITPTNFPNLYAAFVGYGTIYSAGPTYTLAQVDALITPRVDPYGPVPDHTPTVNCYIHSGDPDTSYSIFNYTPASELGTPVTSFLASPGAVADTYTMSNVDPLSWYGMDFQTDHAVNSSDFGPSWTGQVSIIPDITWRWYVKWKPGPLIRRPPLRWFQRDDGLGVSGVKRQTSGTSIQSSKRQVSAYR